MLTLPQDPKDRLQILYALWTINHERKFLELRTWLESEWVRLARASMHTEGATLHRSQGAEILLDKLLEYVKTSGDEINKWEDHSRSSRETGR